MLLQLSFCGQETETTVAYGLLWNPSGPGVVKANTFSYCPWKTQDCFSLLRGIPNCGHCADASARKASATK